MIRPATSSIHPRPNASRRAKSVFGLHKGQIKILGDIIEPIDVEWEADS